MFGIMYLTPNLGADGCRKQTWVDVYDARMLKTVIGALMRRAVTDYERKGYGDCAQSSGPVIKLYRDGCREELASYMRWRGKWTVCGAGNDYVPGPGYGTWVPKFDRFSTAA